MIASNVCFQPDPRRRRVRTWALLIAFAALVTVLGAPGAGSQRVLLLDVRGAIGPALSDYLQRGIERAREDSAEALIVRMDTPGGLDTSMRVMIKAIISSPVPVITYVSPGGARAASAGTYLLYASHVAAMAPGTNLGAATPIPLGPGMQPPAPKPAAPETPAGAPDSPPPGDARRSKIVNDAAAYLRSLAELRGRNADWAERAVREGASLSAAEALEAGVIDVMAEDVKGLLVALDGRSVTVAGRSRTLTTAGWALEAVVPDWRTELLSVITNPNVAYILLLIGFYGLVFEFYSGGTGVFGIAGVIALLMALYALNLLPVNYAGAALILVGLALLAAELFTPSFGVLGAGGLVAFVAGSVMLFDTDMDGLAVSIPLIVTVSLVFAALFLTTAILFARQRRRPVVTGREEFLGAEGRALEAFAEQGRVHVHGENWAARTASPVSKGQTVTVQAVHGLTLEVQPAQDAPAAQEE